MNRVAKLLLAMGLMGLLISVVVAADGPRLFSDSRRARAVESHTYCGVTGSANSLPAEPDARPLVWVVDGAGDLKGCSNALTHANLLAGSTVELAVFPWSHGYRQLSRDQTDWPHAIAQGRRLAAAILDRKKREPNRRVVLITHSAGCAVSLTAGDDLPTDAIDRTILLAPSVSTGYDLRPSLGAAKEGVDVFCSRKDWIALGFVMRIVGTTDRGSRTAAGRFGFQPKGLGAVEVNASGKLRQHFWSPEQAWTGHTGGHHGMHAQEFILAYLFPLIGASVK